VGQPQPVEQRGDLGDAAAADFENSGRVKGNGGMSACLWTLCLRVNLALRIWNRGEIQPEGAGNPSASGPKMTVPLAVMVRACPSILRSYSLDFDQFCVTSSARR
jgi:hypothetical protein